MKKSFAAVLGLLSVCCAQHVSAQSPVNWNGFYIGATGGYGSGDSSQSQAGAVHPGYDVKGSFGGVTVGYNWQFAPNGVLGVEADYTWASLDGEGASSPTFGCNFFITNRCVTQINSFYTFRGRLGYAYGPVLFYGTAGWAFVDQYAEIAGVAAYRGDAVASGYAVGGGIEYLLAKNWSARFEYLYFGMNGAAYAQPAGSPVEVQSEFGIVRLGLSYRFGN